MYAMNSVNKTHDMFTNFMLIEICVHQTTGNMCIHIVKQLMPYNTIVLQLDTNHINLVIHSDVVCSSIKLKSIAIQIL